MSALQRLDEIQHRNAQWELFGGIKGQRESAEDVPLLVEAIESVLDKHTPTTIYEYDDMNGTFALDDNGEQIEMKTLCKECTDDAVLELIGDCEYNGHDYHAETYWPCPTVKAITSVLERAA